jgi:hypothetical protein
MPESDDKITRQIASAGLPTTGNHPFLPRIVKNKAGFDIIERKAVTKGPKRGKKGFVDTQDRIWIRDRAHSDLPDHWDVQLNDGESYFRVDGQGEELTGQ